MSATSPDATGTELRAARAKRGLSQADLARLLGTTQQTVGRWEQGQRPQPRWRRQIEEFLDETARPVLRLAPAVAQEPAPTLDDRQSRALNAFFSRVETGAALTAAEADIFRTAFVAVGLDPAGR